jgi:hypothetical protein
LGYDKLTRRETVLDKNIILVCYTLDEGTFPNSCHAHHGDDDVRRIRHRLLHGKVRNIELARREMQQGMGLERQKVGTPMNAKKRSEQGRGHSKEIDKRRLGDIWSQLATAGAGIVSASSERTSLKTFGPYLGNNFGIAGHSLLFPSLASLRCRSLPALRRPSSGSLHGVAPAMAM